MVIDYKKLYNKYKTKYKKLDTPCSQKGEQRAEILFKNIINYHNKWWKSFMKEEDFEYRRNKYFKPEKYDLHKYDEFYADLTHHTFHYTNHDLRGELDNLREKMINYKLRILNLLQNNKDLAPQLKKLHNKNKALYNTYPRVIYKKLQSLNIHPINISENDLKWNYDKIEVKKCKLKEYNEEEFKSIENDIERLEFLIEFTLKEFDIIYNPT